MIDVGATTRVHCLITAYRGVWAVESHSQGQPLAHCVEILREVIRTWEHEQGARGDR